MNPSLTEKELLESLLALVVEARTQVEARGQPALTGFLKSRGHSAEHVAQIVDHWSTGILAIIQEMNQPSVTLSERNETLQTGALRFLLACLIPNYAERLSDDPRYSRAPLDERRSTIQLTPEEIRHLLQASLVEGAFAD